MFAKLVFLFIAVPLVELALLIEIGKHVGVMATVALVVVTGAAGAALARQQGLATLRRAQEAMQVGQLPGEELMDGMMILIAGAFLITPGLLTDALGFALLIPGFRKILKRWLKAHFEKRLVEPGVYDVSFKE